MLPIATNEIALSAAGHDFTVRSYAAPDPNGTLLVWVHGGSFMFGDLDMPEADETARALAHLGTSVLSVDYTLAPTDVVATLRRAPAWDDVPSLDGLGYTPAWSRPRAPYPVASLQVVAAFDWARDHATDLGASPDNVSIGGGSAGGNLAGGAALRLRARGPAQPSTVTLIYPLLHHTLPEVDEELIAKLAKVPAELDYPPEVIRPITDNYLGGLTSDEPYAFPAGHDLRGLAATLIVTADSDRLRVSGEAYAAELAQAGVDVELVREPGSLHGFLNTVGDPAAARTIARMSRFLTEHAA